MGQFIQYTSGDASAPQLAGTAGSLIAVLDACLITGYGAKAAAGWTHPVATSGNIASYKQGTGSSGFGLVINDNGPNVTSTYRDARAIGWEVVAGVGAPVGSGTGQFPTPAQANTTGFLVIRKSVSADAVARPWVLFADSRTFYLFTATGDTAGSYHTFGFGDIYSYGGTGDAYRCMIMAKINENAGGAENNSLDYLSAFNAAVGGNYIARTAGGTGGSLNVGKHADAVKCATNMIGTCVYPNTIDSSLLVSPIYVHQIAEPSVRGYLRGAYVSLHPTAGLTDAVALNGTGESAGKTFYVIKLCRNGGIMLIETSNTVDTN